MSLFNYSGEHVVFLPWHMEFGWLVMVWMRVVHSVDARKKTVCCRHCDRVYFPSADEFIDWVPPSGWDEVCGKQESARVDVMRQYRQFVKTFDQHVVLDPTKYSWSDHVARMCSKQNKFKLSPTNRGLQCDVVVSCRNRQHAASRNWQHWNELSRKIDGMGLTIGVVGEKETSFDLVEAKIRSWNYPDGDACVEMLQNCKLYIGTDTGPSHLAAFCDTPMIVFRASDGSADRLGQMRDVTDSFFKRVDAWNSPALLIKEIEMFFQSKRRMFV